MKTASKITTLLKKARIDAGLSQWDVAKRLGYSSSQIVSNWERDMQAPPINILKKLCQMYNVDVVEILDMFVENYRHEIYQNVGVDKVSK